MNAEATIRRLGLLPHPEGGFYRQTARGCLVATSIALAAGSASAQSESSIITVRPEPSLPQRGSVARLIVIPRAGQGRLLGIHGDAAGEPLHFEAEPKGGFAAVFGVPLEGADSLAVKLVFERSGQSDSTEVVLAVRTPAFSQERLRVPPSMAQPDSATQVRIAAELEQGRGVSRRSHDTPRLWAGGFRAPRGSRITSRYGTAREYNGEVTSRHLGTDYAGVVGDPVRAAGRGVVALVADFYLAGRAVYLDHGAGLVTGYFHLSRTSVAQGDTVAVGQLIGAVGRSGRVTGPHLHWIARYGGITVDPLSLLTLR
jgi:murein DD-endopeptidase MepM/ murein hydrolase activator NlpD